MSQHLKCKKKPEMSLKLKFHPKIKFNKKLNVLKLKCYKNKKLPKTEMSQN